MTRLILGTLTLLALAVALWRKRAEPVQPDEYADLIPMTWSLPDGYAATYRYILGPTGVPSSLN